MQKSNNKIGQYIKDNYITLIVCVIFTIIYVMNDLLGNNQLFDAWSGSGFMKLNSQYYRLLTASFLHCTSLHLIANTLSLLFLGFFLEKRMGHLRFLFIYLLCDLLASLMFYGYFNLCSGGNGSSIVLYALYAILLIKWLRTPSLFTNHWYHPGVIYSVGFFSVASFFSGNETTIIIHAFSFFVGLIIGLIELLLMNSNSCNS